jgi:hypothetical protein
VSWRQISLAQAFDHFKDNDVEERTSDRTQVPDNSQWHAYYPEEFEAARFRDGSWIAIEHSPGEPNYSELTPGEPGYTAIWLWEAA